MRAALAATPFASLGTKLSSHRAITRVSLAALAFLIVAVASQQAPAQAGPEPAPVVPESVLPLSVGTAIDTSAAIEIPFNSPMDPASVEASLALMPEHSVELAWNQERTVLTIAPQRLWRTDERYLVVVGMESATADGATLRGAKRFSFTTATAPTVSDFQLHLASVDLSAESAASDVSLSVRNTTLEADAAAQSARDEVAQPIGDGAVRQAPSETATRVSASTSVSIGFSTEMDRADVESRFAITPAVEGSLGWVGGNLVFTPSERLKPGTRFTISLVGAHDAQGNPLGGEENFSFIVQRGAQMAKTSPALAASDVEPTRIEMWFSQPMDRAATARALAVTNTVTGSRVWGTVTWNDSSTRMVFTPKSGFAAGGTYAVTLRKGGRDADGNVVKATWSFSTKAPPPVVVAAPPPVAAAAPAPATPGAAPAPARPSVPAAAPATSLAGYALNQVNAARAAYGFAPLVLDARISAVASAHAWDQARNNYFSHFGQNGSSRQSRLAAGGVSYGWSGENQCYHLGMSQQATLNWCHQQFMAEPYPGHFNHIANILNPRAKRMGVGIATVGSKTVITWNFTD